MIKSPDCRKKFHSAQARFLEGALDNFFKRELPKVLGPILRSKLIEELLKLFKDLLPLKEHVKPGQIVWNAVSITTRADWSNVRFVPVTLTMIDEKDIEQLARGVTMSEIAKQGIARITKEAYEQGALLSMRDIGLLTWRYSGAISAYRKQYEKEHDVTLPHPGSLQDMGSCVSHKSMIVRKVAVDKKDPLNVARETNHSQWAVDRYLKDFNRVRLCREDGKDSEFISLATGLNKSVVNEYIKIIEYSSNCT
jgi:hypothetical protein